MASKARLAAEISGSDMTKALIAISSYLEGTAIDPAEMAATEKFLNSLPEAKIAELKSISDRANYNGPKLEPGVMYGIYIDHLKIAEERGKAQDELREMITDLIKADPNKKEKLLGVIDAYKSPATQVPNLGPAVSPLHLTIREKFAAPTEMPVQQQQAYLRLLSHDIGPNGLDGVAGAGSKTQKALEEFAKQNGVDPKDTAKLNQALYTAAMRSQTGLNPRSVLQDIEGGKLKPDDIKTAQWVLKGLGAEMPLSLKNGKMDGVAGTETKKELRASIELADRETQRELLRELQRETERNDPLMGRRGRARSPSPYADLDNPLRLFRDNLRDILIPFTETLAAEIGVLKRSVIEQGGFSDVLANRGDFGLSLKGAFDGAAGRDQPISQMAMAMGMGEIETVNVRRKFIAKDTMEP